MTDATAVWIHRLPAPDAQSGEIVQRLRRQYAHVLVVLTGAGRPPEVREPLTTAERTALLRSHAADAAQHEQTAASGPLGELHITEVPDHLYSPLQWRSELQAAVSQARPGETRLLIVQEHDEYLRPGGNTLAAPNGRAPDGRELAGLVTDDWVAPLGWSPVHVSGLSAHNAAQRGAGQALLDDPARAFEVGSRLNKMGLTDPERGPRLENLRRQLQALRDRPWPALNLSVDVVVRRSSHLLVVRRQGAEDQLGHGLTSLPGAMLRPGERLFEAAVRALRSKTGLGERFETHDWLSYLQGQATFDHPLRSARGATVTTAFFLDLGDGPLPELKVPGASWISLRRAPSEPWFEDHLDLAEHFLYAPR